MNDSPALSVVALLGNQRDRAQIMLDSLLAQPELDRMEIILFECQDGFDPLDGCEHPSVEVHRAEPGAHFGNVRTVGVRLAKAPIVAFVEEHTYVYPGWASAVIAAHAEGWAGVGPEIHIGNPGQGIAGAIKLYNYPNAMPPLTRGETTVVSGHNSSYLRDVLLDFGDDLDDLLLAEIVLQWEIMKKGHKLGADPDVKVAHRNEIDAVSICIGLYHVNRLLAPVRIKFGGWSLPQVLARIILAPINPWRRMLTLGRFYFTKRRDLLARFLLNVPLFVVLDHAAVLGHTVGLLLGGGDAPARFLEYETCRYRGIIHPLSFDGNA